MLYVVLQNNAYTIEYINANNRLPAWRSVRVEMHFSSTSNGADVKQTPSVLGFSSGSENDGQVGVIDVVPMYMQQRLTIL